MASEIPDGLAIQPVWAVEAAYGPDASERRPLVRFEHLTRIRELMDAGVVIAAGAYSDMSGSLLLVHAADEAAALALFQSDVYTRTGVWTDIRVRAMGLVTRVRD